MTDAPTFKVMLVGAPGVGKSALIQKVVHNRFSYDYSVTEGVEFFTKEVTIDSRRSVKMQLFDTVSLHKQMGQEVYQAIVRTYYRGVAAVILLYAIDRVDSFKRLPAFITSVRDNTSQTTLIFLLGSKLDLDSRRQVSSEEAAAFARECRVSAFSEVSAKTGENIPDVHEPSTVFRQNWKIPFEAISKQSCVQEHRETRSGQQDLRVEQAKKRKWNSDQKKMLTAIGHKTMDVVNSCNNNRERATTIDKQRFKSEYEGIAFDNKMIELKGRIR